MSKNGEIYTAGKNFTLPPALTGWTNSTSDYWGLKDPPEVRVHHETCSTICGTPFPAIWNQKKSTGLAGGAKNSQNWPIFVPSKIP